MYHLLNPFPELLTYSALAPFILRVVLGLIFVDLGILKFRSEKRSWIASFNTLGLRPADLFVSLYGLIQIVGGLMLIRGVWVQVAALVFVISSAIEFGLEWKVRDIIKRDIVFYLLILTISLSLLLTGAGAYAVDIPL